MRMHADVASVGMTRFGKHLEQTLKGTTGEAIDLALCDAVLKRSEIQDTRLVTTATAVVTGEEMIRAEAAQRGLGIGVIPVANVENACESSSTAPQKACAPLNAGATTLSWPAASRSFSMRTSAAASARAAVPPTLGIRILTSMWSSAVRWTLRNPLTPPRWSPIARSTWTSIPRSHASTWRSGEVQEGTSRWSRP
jgi:hypothetical protein